MSERGRFKSKCVGSVHSHRGRFSLLISFKITRVMSPISHGARRRRRQSPIPVRRMAKEELRIYTAEAGRGEMEKFGN